MTDVKICGLTRPGDVALACELGARYVGFNFAAASPRRVDPSRAQELAAACSAGVLRVGVFVDESPEEIRAAADAASLDLLQIHRALAEADLSLPRPVIALLRVDSRGEIGGTAPVLFEKCRAVLVDTAAAEAAGGTGRTFDWSALDGLRVPVPLFLAGGLDSGNVGSAIARVRPAAVDVASGVEASPGVKDPNLLERFFRAVRRADTARADAATA